MATGAVVTAIAFAVLITSVDPSPVQLRAAPTDPACDRRGSLSLCVWPESRSVLPAALTALTTTVAAADPLFPVSRTYAQPGIIGPDGEAVTVELPSVNVSDEELLFHAVRAVVPALTCDSQPAATAWFNIVDLVTARTGTADVDPSNQPSESITALLGEPLAQQIAWVDRQRQVIDTCSE
jgi:hypothetical protein